MPVEFRNSTAVAAAAAALILLAGCSTAPRVSSQAMPRVDFNAFQTYAWVDPIGTDFKGEEETRMTRRFKAAVGREMEELGFRFSEDDPDLRVNFFVNAREEKDVQTRATPMLGSDYYEYRYGMYTAWPAYRITVQDVDYAVGTATVDVIDAEKNQLIWEGRLEGRLTQRALVNPGAVVSDVVSDIFVRFPTRNQRKPDMARN